MARSQENMDGENHEQCFAKMLIGIRKYQTSNLISERLELSSVLSIGEFSLSTLTPLREETGLTPVLLIPSMVNRAFVFNLMKGRSMMGYFAEHGFLPILADWGEPSQDIDQATFDLLFEKKLLPALDFIVSTYKQKPHIMGYCMGGTLSVGLASQRSDLMRSLTLLSAPWDFHAGDAALRKRIDFWRASAMVMLSEKGLLEQSWLQTVFASLDPLVTRNKFMRFADMAEDSEEERVFIAIEDWLNDGVDLPADIARECISGWYDYNKPLCGGWIIRDHVVDPQNIMCPVHVIASRKDKLVDYESSQSMLDLLPEAAMYEPQCGHISMIAGRNAIKDVWKPMLDFIISCNS